MRYEEGQYPVPSSLRPAYGRDYRSKREVQDAWDSYCDFIINDAFHPYAGKKINKTDWLHYFISYPRVFIRYKKLTSIQPIDTTNSRDLRKEDV